MRSIDPALQAHLDSGATTLCTCWRIVRRDGAALGFTDHDRVLRFGGLDYVPDSGATGASLASSADLAVDNTQIEGALCADALSAADLAAGRYDGAGIEVYRVNWAAPAERALLKKGVIGEVRRDGGAFRAEMRGLGARLDQPTGRVYQRLCDVNLGSRACGVGLDAPVWRTAGAVTALLGASDFSASGFSGVAEGWFAHGVLCWTSGANAGLKMPVKAQSASGAVSLWRPPGAAMALGDAFTATAGCDKRAKTCREKFANITNFRGFPFMPGNDAAISYPLRGEPNDGGKRR